MREGIALRAGPLSYRPSGTGRIGGYFPGISCQAYHRSVPPGRLA